MKVRQATQDDLCAIAGLHVASWRSAYAGLLPADYLELPVERDLGALWTELRADDLVLVACDADAIVGFVAFRPDTSEDGPLLDNLHVAPERRGEGVGEFLMRASAAALREIGEMRFWLTVIDENSGARRFYARMGGLEGPVFWEDLKGNPVRVRKVTWVDLPL